MCCPGVLGCVETIHGPEQTPNQGNPEVLGLAHALIMENSTGICALKLR